MTKDQTEEFEVASFNWDNSTDSVITANSEPIVTSGYLTYNTNITYDTNFTYEMNITEYKETTFLEKKDFLNTLLRDHLIEHVGDLFKVTGHMWIQSATAAESDRYMPGGITSVTNDVQLSPDEQVMYLGYCEEHFEFLRGDVKIVAPGVGTWIWSNLELVTKQDA